MVLKSEIEKSLALQRLFLDKKDSFAYLSCPHQNNSFSAVHFLKE